MWGLLELERLFVEGLVVEELGGVGKVVGMVLGWWMMILLIW